MPLPANGLTWPPAELATITPRLTEWSAWYSGDPNALNQAYASSNTTGPIDRVAQYRGGVSGAVARMWWGRPIGYLTKGRPAQLHIPLATDLCQASADLLFSEPPTFTVDSDEATQARLDELANDGMHGTLAEAAEAAAALGGVYLRTTWDETVADAPFLTRVDADAAWPEFRWGRLVAVTFWTVVRREDGDRVWRHLERHELAGEEGVILHGLYAGTGNDLGRAVPLTEAKATAGLADVVGVDGQTVSTGSPGLAVEYVPNQRPQRRWREHHVGRHLGRSDLDGVETLMDSLDETWSSWMRDLRLAKARIIVPDYMLEDLGPGQGATFDTDREVFSTLKASPTSNMGITTEQFAIRVAEHQQTATSLVRQILRTAGYSAQTFGEAEGGGMKTATEVVSEQNRSFMTRDRKIRLWRPALSRSLEKLLAVDRSVFGTANQAGDVTTTFGDGVQADIEGLARTAQALRTAQAASTEALVRLTQPDLDDDAVKDEVGRIQAEQGMAVPDPGALP